MDLSFNKIKLLVCRQFYHFRGHLPVALSVLFLFSCGSDKNAGPVDRATPDKWSEPYRRWHYYSEPVIPADLVIPGFEDFHSFDVPTVYQIPDQTGKWFMSFIRFNGKGYNTFVVESTDLVHWTNPRLAMGFGAGDEFDYGGCVTGAYFFTVQWETEDAASAC